nr:immunoglobulin light chain junction region [Macaca mulatta]MOV66120.1 immunoglobulin light chain junction region [Macaca mulatta]MOV66174.1 immunoglobulin light chain junction region [Macaca mulatta]MOV66184.1 immunoglobulin light chain junction region [Macaca mulatta]MOV66426.1 immunoglobulin light chain junction region [Macaca mulatta]
GYYCSSFAGTNTGLI